MKILVRAARFAAFACGSAAALAQPYAISIVAGGAPPPTPVAAVSASIGGPQGVTTDSGGNVYFTSLNCVFKVDQNGILTRVAGTSRPGYTGDGGPALFAQLDSPRGLAVDSAGNVYIADTGNYRVRKVSSGGTITTFAGNGALGDGSPAASAQLNEPFGVALDAAGNVYIADTGNNRIRKVSLDGIISTVAGNGGSGFAGDGGPATSATLNSPKALVLDNGGNLFIGDYLNYRVRRVAVGGVISTVAGGGNNVYGDNIPATSAHVNPEAVAIDGAGNLYIGDSYLGVRKVTPAGVSTMITHNGACYDPICSCPGPSGVAADAAGNIYFTDEGHYLIDKISPAGKITTVAGGGNGSFAGDNAAATAAQLYFPQATAVDAAGNLYIADTGNNRVRKVSPLGIITAVAGNGNASFPGISVAGFSGDGGPATSASLDTPQDLAVDGGGNLYILDYGNNRIRKVSPSGIISTYAGSATVGYSGDGGPANRAGLNNPQGIALDAAGNLYIADSGNRVIRMVDVHGTITTFFQETDKSFGAGYYRALAVDGAGNAYAADSCRIRKIAPDKTVTLVATGTCGPIGSATAPLGYVYGLGVDAVGNIYTADYEHVIKIDPKGIVTTVAEIAAAAVSVDVHGNVYATDPDDSAIFVSEPAGPAPTLGAVVNAAGNASGALAPGEIVALYGARLGPPILMPYPSNFTPDVAPLLAGRRVLFNGTPAPVLYSWSGQAGAIVPYSVTGPRVQVAVDFLGQTSPPVTMDLAPSSPGVFSSNASGSGQAAAVNQDGSLNAADHPAPIGSFVSLYATGAGATSPAGVDGKPGGLAQPVLAVTVTIGGKPAEVQYAGGAGGLVSGLTQINARIPQGILPGIAVPVVVRVGDAASHSGITIAVSGN